MGMANIIANIINITKVLMANWSLMLLLHNLHSKEWNPLGRHHKRRPPSSQISKTVFFCLREEATSWDNTIAGQEQPASNLVPWEAKTSPDTS